MSESTQSPEKNPDLSFVKEIPLGTAEDFLDALRPSNERWRSDPLDPDWLFRGQSIDQPPMASAWRKPPLDLTMAVRPQVEALTNPRVFKFDKGRGGPFQFRDTVRYSHLSQQTAGADLALRARDFERDILTEFYLVHRFWEIAEQAGHALEPPPWLKSVVNDPFDCVSSACDGRREDRFQCPVFAVARHHHIPTRLIDWTTHPLIAAFFAAGEDRETTDGKAHSTITVWAFRRNWLTVGDPPIVEFRPPRSILPRFARQEGRFLWQPYAHEYYPFHGRWPSVQDTVDEMWRHAGAVQQQRGIPLIKVTLPRKHRAELRQLLWHERQFLANLMPELDYVATSLKQRLRSTAGSHSA